MRLLYLHGFNSSPSSFKAQKTAHWLTEKHPEVDFICPVLSPFPKLAIKTLTELIAGFDDRNVLVMGSSMGGFYATWVAQVLKCNAVLINPAVRPWQGREHLLGQQKNYHTNEEYRFEQKHLEAFQQWDVQTLTRPEKTWVLLQTGDEILDYRLAAEKYKNSRVTIEQGGDHSFQNYEQYLPEIYQFWTQDVV